MIAEAIYPNYSSSTIYISDLGVQSKPFAAIRVHGQIHIRYNGHKIPGCQRAYPQHQKLRLLRHRPGSIERMMVYPIILWIIGFGGYLLSNHKYIGNQ